MTNNDSSPNVVNFLQWKFQKECAGHFSSFGWCSEVAADDITDLDDPLFFYVVEPLIMGKSLVCVVELGFFRALVESGLPPLPVGPSELAPVANDLTMDVLYRDKNDLPTISAMFAANLLNFSTFNTAAQLLQRPRNTGEHHSGGIIHYLSSGDVGADRTSRPFAWNAPSLLTPFEVLQSCAPYVIHDSTTRPERYSKFPVAEFLERLSATAAG